MKLGIDLGGTKIEIIALDDQSNERYRHRIDSPQGSYDKTVQAITDLVLDTEKLVDTKGSLGIGIPGAISPETGLIKNANSTWLIGHDLKTDLQHKLERNISIANDADCFTLSEASDGAASNHSLVFGIILGTGVGGGLLIEKKLISGPNAICGEWGHNPLPWPTSEDEASVCYCGKMGCIETYLSGPGMLAKFQRQHSDPSVTSSRDIVRLLRQGDDRAKAYMNQYLDRLGKSLASVINILDPHAIVFGGGLSNIDELYPAIKEHVARYIFSDSVRTKFLKAKHGDSSGVRGAAWLGAANI